MLSLACYLHLLNAMFRLLVPCLCDLILPGCQTSSFFLLQAQQLNKGICAPRLSLLRCSASKCFEGQYISSTILLLLLYFWVNLSSVYWVLSFEDFNLHWLVVPSLSLHSESSLKSNCASNHSLVSHWLGFPSQTCFDHIFPNLINGSTIPLDVQAKALVIVGFCFITPHCIILKVLLSYPSKYPDFLHFMPISMLCSFSVAKTKFHRFDML